MTKSQLRARRRLNPRWGLIIVTVVAQLALGVLYAWATASL